MFKTKKKRFNQTLMLLQDLSVCRIWSKTKQKSEKVKEKWQQFSQTFLCERTAATLVLV